MRRISEQDEFLLSCLIDGDLSPEQASRLRERMEREPELRAAFTSLNRVNELLAVRRADRPSVDLRALHTQVMRQVEERAARPSILRLPFWVRVAMPLAAAAAVALVVTANLNRHSGPATGGAMTVARNDVTPAQPAPSPTVQPIQRTPSVAQSRHNTPTPRQLAQAGDQGRNRAVVRFNRPTDASARSQVHVSYVRSAELAQAMKARDDERRSRPSWTSYVAEVSQPARQVVVEDLPPL